MKFNCVSIVDVTGVPRVLSTKSMWETMINPENAMSLMVEGQSLTIETMVDAWRNLGAKVASQETSGEADDEPDAQTDIEEAIANV
jgi:hypothetical protein